MSSLYNYGDNYVRTTKYTVATFLPKSLFEQFRRVANFYFLVVAILSFFPVAPYSAVSNVIPLLVVVSATMAKEFIEDFQRKKQVLFLFYSFCQI
jgi:phospholipid-translocating ATPase